MRIKAKLTTDPQILRNEMEFLNNFRLLMTACGRTLIE